MTKEVGIEGFAEWRARPGDDRPDVSFVPALSRRRLTPVERAAMHVAHEAMSRAGAEPAGVPVVFNPCPSDKTSERANMKKLLRSLPVDNEMLRLNIFGAVKRGLWPEGIDQRRR